MELPCIGYLLRERAPPPERGVAEKTDGSSRAAGARWARPIDRKGTIEGSTSHREADDELSRALERDRRRAALTTRQATPLESRCAGRQLGDSPRRRIVFLASGNSI